MRNSRKYFIGTLLFCLLLGSIHSLSPIITLPPASASGDYSKPPDASKGTGPYKDGHYQGTATGYNGDMVISVTIEKGWISALTILKTGDDKEYLAKVKDPILMGVLDKQSTEEIEAVSGATFSSYGILDAIDDALAKA